MSSTTERCRERGQILVIFAVSLVVILSMAALVFDTGLMLLERRSQQNAGDAAALAGARFLPDRPADAISAAVDVATANGFTDGVDSQSVSVNVPPLSGPNVGRPGHIEVLISSARPSLFARIWGVGELDVGSRAVAANHTGVTGPFALLSLDPTGCEALIVEGQGELIANGNIQVNSTCENALRLAGQGEIVTAPDVACNIAGGFSAGGAASYNCEVNEGVQSIPDPLAGLSEPPIPVDPDTSDIIYPTPPAQEGGASKDIPSGCPGSASPATEDAPALCQFPGSYAGTTWRLYPGYYPGGLHLEAGDFYLEPGIYYFAGGGITINGGGAGVISVDAGGTTLGGGVMLYNGDHATAADGAIYLAGGDAGVHLWPLNDADAEWNGIVIFQDREVCLDAKIVGASSSMTLRGTIYIPCGTLIAEGNGGTVTTDQIIAFRFQMKGNIGSLTVAYDESFLPPTTVAGLVE
ncbi:MAG: pilus assembly protein TadG-related protein [Candidatus Limnocylindria bacterium]